VFHVKFGLVCRFKTGIECEEEEEEYGLGFRWFYVLMSLHLCDGGEGRCGALYLVRA
jgi:hypothetical protein